MAYNKTNWNNLPSTSTPVNASNLNKIENELEYLDNANVYSTTETVIGTYKGKPLYRKMITLQNININAGENSFNHGIANLAKCVHAEMTDPSQWYIFPYIWNTSREMTGINAVVSTTITISSTANWGATSSYDITLEYTKTTD